MFLGRSQVFGVSGSPEVTVVQTKHLRPTDYLAQPWKNGLGKTEEIAKDANDPFHWRLSRASLSGKTPFSLFPDYDRSLVFLGDSPLQLAIGERARTIAPFSAVPFSGDLPVTAEVSTPGSDFNLFVYRPTTRGAIYPSRFARGEELQFPLVGQEHFIYAVSGEANVEERNTKNEFVLKAGETFWVSRPDSKEYLNIRVIAASAQTQLLWVVIRPQEPQKVKKAVKKLSKRTH